ncbi:MAG TPA: glycoside hydrolase family 76 protein [Candidatus Limnocylindrales bacterium]|nr:glycoside hydrolase family 76 protein [Candidatus Limnocylindrales bacterium]
MPTVHAPRCLVAVAVLLIGGSAIVAPSPSLAIGPNGFTVARAATAFDAMLAAYWQPASQTFYARSDHQVRPGHAATADFWWTAELWEAVIDAAEAHVPAADRMLLDATYDGFVAGSPTLDSDFNDDRGWWALAAIRAYALTGELRYLARAESLSDDQWRSWDSTYGGGLWWRRSVHDQKNVATNAPAAMTAALIYAATGSEAYLDRATQLYRWLASRLRSGSGVADHVSGGGDGTVDGSSYTYDEGAYIGAAVALYQATGEPSYLDDAEDVASGVIAATPGRVLPDEGQGDGGGFKGILVRDLAALVTVDRSGSLRAFLAANADAAWAHRRGDGLSGPSWSATPGPGSIDSLTDASAVALFSVVVVIGATPGHPTSVVDPGPSSVSTTMAASRSRLASWAATGEAPSQVAPAKARDPRLGPEVGVGFVILVAALVCLIGRCRLTLRRPGSSVVHTIPQQDDMRARRR